MTEAEKPASLEDVEKAQAKVEKAKTPETREKAEEKAADTLRRYRLPAFAVEQEEDKS